MAGDHAEQKLADLEKTILVLIGKTEVQPYIDDYFLKLGNARKEKAQLLMSAGKLHAALEDLETARDLNDIS